MEEKLKKALECCKNNDMCPECPLISELYCREILTAEAGNYIADLEERIAIMQESMETLEKRCNTLNALEQRCNALEALEERCNALEKQNELKAVEIDREMDSGLHLAHCPNCWKFINSDFHYAYCGYCGQAAKLGMDRENVIKALECIKNADKRCGNPCEDTGLCHYRTAVRGLDGEIYRPFICDRERICADALALLKEQDEPIKPTLNESHSYVSDAFKCGKCGHTIRFHAKYCEECGQAVKWNE